MNRALSRIFLLGFILLADSLLAAPRIARWTEGPGELGLGYPVPYPVDTPQPFDGFRTYNGLRTRHFELAAETGVVHRHKLGKTFRGATINAWQLGDKDLLDNEGLPEAAMLTNGGTHAREWQSPEVLTGIMELFAANEGDDGFYGYLLENANIILIPVLNIDGFRQTQRYPDSNWLETDPRYSTWPRDGRMRRKNMRAVDFTLSTRDDHLLGVDLNRNNPPFWATSWRSSDDNESLVYHGTEPHSEPEARALAAAAALGPEDRLRLYTDVHSYTQVHFWPNTGDVRLSWNITELLQAFSDHHVAFPRRKLYTYDLPVSPSANNRKGSADTRTSHGFQGSGIGATDEYFAKTYGIPAWTLEVEPSGGDHPGLPGNGADYGGLASNGHDGFILPDSQIRRVRETLAQSFAVTYYKQTGPAFVRRVRVIDPQSGQTVYAADWIARDGQTRELFSSQPESLVPGRDYQLWVGFNKPMRWRDDQGAVVPLQGFPQTVLEQSFELKDGEQSLDLETSTPEWLNQPGQAPDGYLQYRDDAFRLDFRIVDNQANRDILNGGGQVNIHLQLKDLTGDLIDARPETVADWGNGGWTGLENSNGVAGDFGGTDSSLPLQVTTSEPAPAPRVDSSYSAAWFDASQDKQGLLLEILDNDRAVIYWFTYDHEGNQRYLNGVGRFNGNRIVFDNIFETRGGHFSNPGAEPELINRGQAEIIVEDCASMRMDYTADGSGGHLQLTRLTNMMGYYCGNPLPGTPVLDAAKFSGTWINTDAGNHGLVVEVLQDSRILAYWFSYDDQGRQRWYFGTGRIEADEFVFPQFYTTSGGLFGKPAELAPAELLPWGTVRLRTQCQGSRLSYSRDTGDSGQFTLARLTYLQAANCVDN